MRTDISKQIKELQWEHISYDYRLLGIAEELRANILVGNYDISLDALKEHYKLIWMISNINIEANQKEQFYKTRIFT